MGIRERIQREIARAKAKARQRAAETTQRARESVSREELRRRARQAGERIQQPEQRSALPTDSREAAQNAERSATMGAPVNARLEPTTNPETVELMARGGIPTGEERRRDRGGQPAQERTGRREARPQADEREEFAPVAAPDLDQLVLNTADEPPAEDREVASDPLSFDTPFFDFDDQEGGFF